MQEHRGHCRVISPLVMYGENGGGVPPFFSSFFFQGSLVAKFCVMLRDEKQRQEMKSERKFAAWCGSGSPMVASPMIVESAYGCSTGSWQRAAPCVLDLISLRCT